MSITTDKWYVRTAIGPGETGNDTSNGVKVLPETRDILLNFIVEAAGAGPTVTYKWQYSLDAHDITDAAATWTDVSYTLPTDTAETFASTTRARTSVSIDTLLPYMGAKVSMAYRRFRVVTTSNTNITYRAEVVMR